MGYYWMSQKKEAAKEVTETGTELKEQKYVREKTRWRVIRIILYIMITLCLVAGRSAQWVTEEWGDLTLDEVIFTMTQPLMISILNSVIPVKAPAKKVTLNEPKLMKYFPADYSPKQMEQIIVSLLEQWKNGQEGADPNGIS